MMDMTTSNLISDSKRSQWLQLTSDDLQVFSAESETKNLSSTTLTAVLSTPFVMGTLYIVTLI